MEQQLGCGRSLLGLSGEWTGWSDAAAVAARQRRVNGAVPDEALGEEVLAVPGEGRRNVGKLVRVGDLEKGSHLKAVVRRERRERWR